MSERNGVTYICPQKDVVCGDKPENWCAPCPLRPSAATPARLTNEQIFRSAGTWFPAVSCTPIPDYTEEHHKILAFGRAIEAMCAAPAVSAPDVAALIARLEGRSDGWKDPTQTVAMLCNEAAAMLRRLSEERDDAVKRMEQGWIQVCQTGMVELNDRAEAAERTAAERGERLERAEKDAARYRWLRDDARREDGPIWCVTWRHGWPEDPRGATDDLFADQLDAAIDAALAPAAQEPAK